MKHRILQLTLLGFSLIAVMAALPAQARDYYYGHHRYDDYHHCYRHGLLPGHPYVRGAAVGGGVGALAGAVLAHDGERVDGAVKGGLLGGGAGLGYEFLRRRGVFSRW